MIEILYGTPKWVYAALFVTLYFGISACFPSKEYPRRLLIVPLTFAALGVYVSVVLAADRPTALGAFAAGTMLGFVASAWAYRSCEVGFDEKSGQLVIPGERLLMVVLLLAFSIKYGIGYWSALDRAAANSIRYVGLNAGVSGAAIGYFTGRALSFRRQFRLGAGRRADTSTT